MMRRTTACVVVGLAMTMTMTEAQAQTSTEGRQPPSKPAYLNASTMVVHDNGHRRKLDVTGRPMTFFRTAGGYAVMSSVPRGDDSVYWLTLFGKKRGRVVVARRLRQSEESVVVVSADGKRIAYVAQPNPRGLSRLVVRRTSDGKLVRKRELADPDSRVLAFRAGEVWYAEDDRFAGRFDFATGKVRRVRKGRGRLGAVAPSRDRAVAGASVVPLPRRGRKGWHVPEHEVLGFSPNGRYVLSYNWDDEGVVRKLVVRNSRTGRLVRAVSDNWFGSPPRIRWVMSSKSFLAVRGGYRDTELVRFGARRGSTVLATFDDYFPDPPSWLPITATGHGVEPS